MLLDGKWIDVVQVIFDTDEKPSIEAVLISKVLHFRFWHILTVNLDGYCFNANYCIINIFGLI